MKTCIPRRILTEWSYIKGLHAISATTMRSVGIRHWTNELRLRYTMESIFINHARIRCSTPPSALRAAPAGTGSAPQRIRQRPKRHETRTPDSTLKWPISGPKDGGRGTLLTNPNAWYIKLVDMVVPPFDSHWRENRTDSIHPDEP